LEEKMACMSEDGKREHSECKALEFTYKLFGYTKERKKSRVVISVLRKSISSDKLNYYPSHHCRCYILRDVESEKKREMETETNLRKISKQKN
jgi:hypothetical protein